MVYCTARCAQLGRVKGNIALIQQPMGTRGSNRAFSVAPPFRPEDLGFLSRTGKKKAEPSPR